MSQGELSGIRPNSGTGKPISGDTATLPPTSYQRREFLVGMNPHFLLASLNEWEIDRRGRFLQGLWNRLHP